MIGYTSLDGVDLFYTHQTKGPEHYDFLNRLSEKALKSKWLLLSITNSDNTSPIAAECLNPWPEHGEAIIIR